MNNRKLLGWNTESEICQICHQYTETAETVPAHKCWRSKDMKHSGDKENIPPLIKLVPMTVQVPVHQIKTINKVYFDLETGGFENGTDILQIAAVCDSDRFSQYVTPTKPVSPYATSVSGLTNVGGVLTRVKSNTPGETEAIATMPIGQALQSMLAWLNDMGPCLIIGHNIHFDRRHLFFHLKNCRLYSSFSAIVLGYVDTCKLFRKLHPEFTRSAGGAGHSQSVLVRELLGEEYNAHDALSDVEALRKLVEFSQVMDKQLLEISTSSEWHHQQDIELAQAEEENLPSLRPIIDSKHVSTTMAKKIARSGLQYHHLQLAYKRGGSDCLKSILSEDNNGEPRVTNSLSVVRKVVQHFETLGNDFGQD